MEQLSGWGGGSFQFVGYPLIYRLRIEGCLGKQVVFSHIDEVQTSGPPASFVSENWVI